jgi:hypothetical protein
MAKKITPDARSYGAIEDRVNRANRTHTFINALAYGKEPETVNMPEELSGTFLGGSFKTPLTAPDASDDAARVPLTRMLGLRQEGINTANDLESVVLRAWEAPPQTPSARGTFMERYRSGRKTEPTPQANVKTASTRLRQLTTDPKFKENKDALGLTASSSPETIFNSMVDSRKSHFSGQLADWYEGPRVGINTQGYPQYEEGASVGAIRERASQAGISESELRRGTAIGSPKTAWQLQSGHMPNLEGSARTMEIALQEPGLDPKKVTSKMKKEFASRKEGFKSTILGSMAPRVAQSARGELSAPYEATTPSKSDIIGTEKVSNFDLGLTNPYHPEYGYSSFVASHRGQAHTSDTHDFGAAGTKTPSIPKLDKEGNPKFKKTKDGKLLGETTNAGETWASSPGGQDLLGASSRVASAESFQSQYDFVGETFGPERQAQWARENAHKFVPNNAQAEQWVASMGRNKEKVQGRRRAKAAAKKSKK